MSNPNVAAIQNNSNNNSNKIIFDKAASPPVYGHHPKLAEN